MARGRKSQQQQEASGNPVDAPADSTATATTTATPKEREWRLYVIVTIATGEQRLIEATGSARAMRFVGEQAFQVSLAKNREVAELVKKGVQIEVAKFEGDGEPAQA